MFGQTACVHAFAGKAPAFLQNRADNGIVCNPAALRVGISIGAGFFATRQAV